MYIKYLNMGYNLENFLNFGISSTNNLSITLKRENVHYELIFNNTITRNDVMSEIWSILKNGDKFFDIDEFLETYIDAKKYNVI